MAYVRAVAGYIGIALITLPLVFDLWGQYQLRQILAAGSGAILREDVAPSWRKLAARVRSGEVTATKEQQASRFDRIATMFEAEARSEQGRTQVEIDQALFFFELAVGVFVIQILVSILLGITDVRKQRRVAHT